MISLLLASLLWPLSSPADVLVKHPELSEHQYLFVVQQTPEGESLKEALEKKIIRQKGDDLLKLYKKAKKAQLQGHLGEAQYVFEKLVSQRHQQIWPTNQQKVIFKSLIELTQLDLLKKKDYYLKALAFDVFGRYESLITTTQIKKDFYKFKMELLKAQWGPQRPFKNSSIYINGQKFTGKNILLLPNQKIRWDFISNSHLPISKTCTLLQLKNKIRFVSAKDHIPQIKKSLPDSELYLIDKNLKVRPLNEPLNLVKSNFTQKQRVTSELKPSKTSWLKYSLVFLGAFFIYSHNQRTSNPQPSHTVGL